jgi:hypothetical protein
VVVWVCGPWPLVAWQVGIRPLWAVMCWASHHGSHGLLAGPGRTETAELEVRPGHGLVPIKPCFRPAHLSMTQMARITRNKMI